MKPAQYVVQATLSGMLLLALSAAGKAVELKVWTAPVTDTLYEPIDTESVRIDAVVGTGATPAESWLNQVRAQNKTLAYDLSARPVVNIEVTLIDPEEDIDSSKPFIEEGRRWAARFGANAAYLDKRIFEDKHVIGMRFVGYRVEYKQHLVTPMFLAALPFVSVPGSILDEQLLAWDVAHFGKVHVSFGSGDDKTAEGKAMGVLASLKNGTSVHVFMRDGSDLQGAFSGLDDENRIWIHTQGWAGLFRDHAVSTRDIQAVALLN